MTNTELLRNIIKESGLKYKFIANKLELSAYGLQKKIDNATEFRTSEISALCKILNIDSKMMWKIFFNEKIN